MTNVYREFFRVTHNQAFYLQFSDRRRGSDLTVEPLGVDVDRLGASVSKQGGNGIRREQGGEVHLVETDEPTLVDISE